MLVLLFKKRWLSFLGASFILILILISLWIVCIFQIKSRLEGMISDLCQEGYDIHYKSLKTEGIFPYIKFKLQDFCLENTPLSKDLNLSLKSDTLSFSFVPFLPQKINIDFQSLKGVIPEENLEVLLGSPSLEISIPSRPFHLTGMIPFLKIKSQALEIDLEDLHLELTPQALTAQNDQGPYAIEGLGMIGFIKKFSFRKKSFALEPGIQDISFSASLMEILDFKRTPQKSLKSILVDWRDKGGALEINFLNLTWGDLKANLQGTLALDEKLNPEGAFTLILQEVRTFLKNLSKNQNYTSQNRLFLELSLGFLSRTSPEIKLPLTLQNQILSIGSFVNISFPSLNESSPT